MIETQEEKAARIFNLYKTDLKHLAEKNGQVRFIVIEYVCSFPKINPYVMAKTLVTENISIIYDDSSITHSENMRKMHKVEKMLKEAI